MVVGVGKNAAARIRYRLVAVAAQTSGTSEVLPL
jgi:hypothetical protein